MTHNVVFGILIGFLFICLIVFFCALLIKLYINKVNNYTKVIYQKDIDYQKSLNSIIIETQEQVLNTISRDLHDDLGQQISFLNMQLESLKFDLPDAQEPLERITNSLANLSKSNRAISRALNSQIVLQQDLIKAITAEVDRLKYNGVMRFDLEIIGEVKRTFNSNEQIVIYRIFQEILNNIFKHSKATEVAIIISNESAFEMIITDNGIGFDLNEVKQAKLTMGLQGLESRAAIIGYQISFDSKFDCGTTVKLLEVKRD
ncbi:histidine kinase [Flavobacterium sp. SUN046]|uniref:sensor histidine kinase n=1 Tax=Flavobacterium sp. SUN046 TaxID=3002440 RepID=UPI002DBA9530|nr:histidine kinase [Flavobacterium sp. SUN046]MEC4050223.1 histidine kinase [Flavobacterium sp. SUN046]